MNRKALWWMGSAVVILALAAGIRGRANGPGHTHLSGLINDYSGIKVNPAGPWEIHGEWTLDVGRESQRADFSAYLTMEHSDYWILSNPNPPADPNTPSTRGPHTHHIIVTDAMVTQIANGFEISGPATVTGNGNPAPFGPNSSITIDVTGGTTVPSPTSRSPSVGTPPSTSA